MNGDGDLLPEEVRRAVARWVDTLDALEVLLLLYRGSPRAFTGGEISLALGISEKAAGRELVRLVSRGVVTTTGDAHRIAEAADVVVGVAAIAGAYRERRVELINHVASSAMRRIQDLADAFRIGRGKKEE